MMKAGKKEMSPKEPLNIRPLGLMLGRFGRCLCEMLVLEVKLSVTNGQMSEIILH